MKKPLLKQQALLADASKRIIRLEANINYTAFIMTNGKHKVMAYCLKKYDALLTYPFIRVNRGCIVNINFVKDLDITKKIIHLHDGTDIQIARRRLYNISLKMTLKLLTRELQLKK